MKKKLLSFIPIRLYLEAKRLIYRLRQPQAYEANQQKREIVWEGKFSDKYSFKPFDDTQSIFIHIPKCAGRSISQSLYGNSAGGHTTLSEYIYIFEPECIINYFIFTVVRNPWDRAVSAYHFLKDFGSEAKEVAEYKTFDDFVKRWLNKENIWKYRHFRPQYHYITDKKIQLDFIGFFENIEHDIVYITNRIGLDSALIHTNRSKHDNFMNYYTDETREIVADVYAKDIALLGYNFDNSSIPSQLANRE